MTFYTSICFEEVHQIGMDYEIISFCHQQCVHIVQVTIEPILKTSDIVLAPNVMVKTLTWPRPDKFQFNISINSSLSYFLGGLDNQTGCVHVTIDVMNYEEHHCSKIVTAHQNAIIGINMTLATFIAHR